MIYLSLIGGLILLIVSGEFLVRSAVGVANRLGLPPLIIGLTIISVGTSAPEFTVSMKAMSEGSSDLVLGGVIGSNIANILLVLGVAALIQPITSRKSIVRRDGLFLVGVSSFLAGLSLIGGLTAMFGAIFIAIYAAYVFYCFLSEKASAEDDEQKEMAKQFSSMWLALFVLAVSLIGVIKGADLLVTAAIELARIFGISEAIIGLSIVAFGTSLPELAISVIAALKREPGVALGNVVGSNISNILLILGASSFVGPLPFSGQLAQFDIWVMLLATIVLVPVLASGQKLSRLEAAGFLFCYVAYITAIYLGAPKMILGFLS